ncbi:MAG: DNA polymerase III subunit beta [Alphaproteobacteria bacterium]|nr:DNA polymerase III subunit beta [Alphaproteobacteria bacterium]
MQFAIERSVLLKALGHVQTVVEKRGTIPVLANVKLDAKSGQLSLTATDMDIALVERVPAEIGREGATTVPAHTFYEIVRKLHEGAQVEVNTGEGGRVSIRSGQSRFTLASLPVDDFPVMAEGELPHSFTLAVAECRALIEKPAYAMSTEETRYYLNGIYLHTSGEAGEEQLKAVATDGHRLARVAVSLPGTAAGMPGIIVPRKTIQEIRKLLDGGDGEVALSLSDTKIRVVYGNAVLVSKLIDGNFPDYERVIPSNNEKMMEVEAKRFAEAVDRVSVIASERSRGIKLSLEKGKVTLSASSAEAGSASEEIEVTYGADALEIGFNARYLLEMLSQLEGETAQFLFHDSASPALVRDTADVGALYVIMPMRV